MSETLPAVGCDDLLCFLRGKLAAAEKALRCREEMAVPPRKISDEEWEELSKMPGVRITNGRRLTKAQINDMKEYPKRQSRIAAKCRHEVEMFRAVIAALDKRND